MLAAFFALVIVAGIIAIYGNFQATKTHAKGMVPSSYTQQWQKAMEWVRENTPEDAVFGHWWDYGYWLQSIGDRATMLDGGNHISYWNYLMGRHGLTADSEEEALELLYNHNVTHFLIDSTEIGKYGAYSRIGSDEEYDKYSWIGTFLMSEKETQETKDEIIYVYKGGVPLDEDYVYESGEEKIFLPSGKTGVGAFLLKLDKNTTNISFKQPETIMVYNGKQAMIPLRYLYYDGKLYDFNEGYEGCLYVIPSLKSDNTMNNLGVGMFLSERNMRALWVRLYLLGQKENFQLVHKEQDYVVKSLKDQGVKIKDFIYYQGVRGPIKIWKVKYTGDEEVNPEYLQIDFPERIKQRKYDVI